MRITIPYSWLLPQALPQVWSSRLPRKDQSSTPLPLTLHNGNLSTTCSSIVYLRVHHQKYPSCIVLIDWFLLFTTTQLTSNTFHKMYPSLDTYSLKYIFFTWKPMFQWNIQIMYNVSKYVFYKANRWNNIIIQLTTSWVSQEKNGCTICKVLLTKNNG